MAKLKTVTYARLKNLANYENERLELTFEIDEGENPIQRIEAIRKLVNKIMGTEKKESSDAT